MESEYYCIISITMSLTTPLREERCYCRMQHWKWWPDSVGVLPIWKGMTGRGKTYPSPTHSHVQCWHEVTWKQNSLFFIKQYQGQRSKILWTRKVVLATILVSFGSQLHEIPRMKINHWSPCDWQESINDVCEILIRVATAQGKQGKQGIWFLIFPDRENTGNFALTQGKILRHRENIFLWHREKFRHRENIWLWLLK